MHPTADRRRPASNASPRDSLWRLVAGPTLWATHFLLCYITAAIWCAKAGADSPLGSSRLLIAGYTVLALAGCALLLRTGWRAHRADGAPPPPHDAATTADRHRFLGFATLLLAGLSMVAIVYGALPALFIEACV